MAIKIRIPRGRRGRFRLSDPILRAGVAAFIIVSTVMLGIFAYYYVKYQKLIDQRMAGPIFANASKIYATPRVIRPGNNYTKEDIVSFLRRAGYSEEDEKGESKLGTYKVTSRGVEVRPGPESFHSSEGALIQFEESKIRRITAVSTGDNVGAWELEPELITGLFDAQQRSKRRLISYDDVPSYLVRAIISIEDRKFFEHSGINYARFAQAAYRNLVSGRRGEGGSTLTMQIARGFFLTPEKSISRKLSEMLISIELEQRYSKKQIFEFYINQVNLGQRGSFSIEGFGEASQAYFGKDIKNLTLPEAALLAGIVQRPSYLSPYKHPKRALARRNLVLQAMVDTGAISPDQAEKAKAAPLQLAPWNVEASDAPYFVDLIKDHLLAQYSEEQLNQDGMRIYSTLDPELQTAAAEAVEIGLKEIDAQVEKMRTKRVRVGKGKSAKFENRVEPGPTPQVALIAMDPRTGEVRAMVGGRNYGFSQLNHAVAKRPTGSVFKPFVFAAAVNNALTGEQPLFTASTPVDNTPTTFFYEDKIYEPRNYGDKYNQIVTTRFALAHSLNNATVRIAEQIGYDRVVQLARQAGITSVRPTPAMALGAYDATPLEIAAAYTIFANDGVRVSPLLITSIRDPKGEVVQDFQSTKKPVLDPRVAYVMTNMMEAVMNNGTAAGVRGRGFHAPAAGKTGTSRDGWFAGYTSNLLCIVWVGYDDYSDLKLEGSKTAAPIWAEFMKRAVAFEQYKNTRSFDQPTGVVNVSLDKVTNRVATNSCPDDYEAAFILGTEPTETCDQSAVAGFFSKIFGGGNSPPQPAVVSNNGQSGTAAAEVRPAEQEKQEKPEEKKGFFGKLFGAFKEDKDKAKSKEAAPPPATPRTP